MGFMKQQAEHMAVWQMETTCGTENVPADLVGAAPTADDLKIYLEGNPLRDAEPERIEGWFARLSAPGYLDCTEWSGPYDSETEALEALTEMYGSDDESDDD